MFTPTTVRRLRCTTIPGSPRQVAFTVTGDAGCEYGGGASWRLYDPQGISPEMGSASTYTGGVNCHNAKNGRPKQAFVGWMMYNRYWFKKDLFAVTLGGGQMNNAGRYLTLLPPINGATAVTGSPYFTENPGDRAQMHDGTITFDYMPSQFITFRLETGYRYSDVPYWSGAAGSRLPAETMASRHSMPVPMGCLPALGTATSPLRRACIGAGTTMERSGTAHLVARSAHQSNRDHSRDHGQILASLCATLSPRRRTNPPTR